MEFWVDIENASGTKYGAGPITSITDWEWRPRLDAAGEFTFHMPASDPKSTILANKRIAACSAIIDGAVTSIGGGIIDRIKTQVGNPTMLTVSGPDLLAELSTRSVHDLVICKQAWASLNDPTHGIYTQISVSESGVPSDRHWEVAACHDGNLNTAGAAQLKSEKDGFPESGIWGYVGYDARFDRIEFTHLASGGRWADPGNVLVCQYYNGSGWVDLAITDGTNNGGTWRSNGQVTFTRPTDWVRCNEAYGFGGDWFWVRMRIKRIAPNNPSSTGYVDWAEIRVYADVPTTNGVNLIMAHAPSTWVRSGYPATVSSKYLEFRGESVLEALVILAEQGGTSSGAAVREHFRYSMTTPRAIDWMGTTITSSGLRAVAPVDSIAAEGAGELVVIESLQRQIDSAEVATRIYPRSANGIGIQVATVSAPTGFTHNLADNWVQHTAGYNAYDLIERWIEFSELSLQQADSYTLHPVALANQVHERACEWLRTHATANSYYRLSIAQFPRLLRAGDTIECVYHEWVDGAHVVDIDTLASGQALYILAPTIEVSDDGVSTIALEVATIDRQLQTDAGVIVDAIRTGRRASGAASNLVTLHVPKVLSGVVGRTSNLSCTTSWQTLLTKTETVPAGRLFVIANVGYVVGSTAGYSFETRLIINGTEQRYRAVDLYHANCTDYVGMSFVVDIPAGSRTWKVEVKKNNSAPAVSGSARSEMSWWLIT